MQNALYYIRKAVALLILGGGSSLLVFAIASQLARVIRGGRFDTELAIVLVILVPIAAAFFGLVFTTTWGRWLGAGVGVFWFGFMSFVIATSHNAGIAYALAAASVALVVCLGGRTMSERTEVSAWRRRGREDLSQDLHPVTLSVHHWALVVNVALLFPLCLSLTDANPILDTTIPVIGSLVGLLLIGVISAAVLYSRRQPVGLFVLAGANLVALTLFLASSRDTNWSGIAVFLGSMVLTTALLTWIGYMFIRSKRSR